MSRPSDCKVCNPPPLTCSECDGMHVLKLEVFGAIITMFENGDIYISTPGDVVITKVLTVTEVKIE